MRRTLFKPVHLLRAKLCSKRWGHSPRGDAYVLVSGADQQANDQMKFQIVITVMKQINRVMRLRVTSGEDGF